MSAVASASGDEACRKLLAVHSAIYGELEPDAFYQEMIAARRLIEGDAVAGTGAAISRMPTRAPEAEGHNTMARSELMQDLYRTYGGSRISWPGQIPIWPKAPLTDKSSPTSSCPQSLLTDE
jgi:hypothetical protein